MNNEMYRKMLNDRSQNGYDWNQKNSKARQNLLNNHQIKIDMKDLKISQRSQWDVYHKEKLLGENTATEIDTMTNN